MVHKILIDVQRVLQHMMHEEITDHIACYARRTPMPKEAGKIRTSTASDSEDEKGGSGGGKKKSKGYGNSQI